MPTNIKSLRAEAARIAAEMRRIHTGAEAEDRALSEAEEAEWGRLSAQFDQIEGRLLRGQRVGELEERSGSRTASLLDTRPDDQEQQDSGWRDERGNEVRVLSPKASLRSAVRGTYDEAEWRGLSFGGFCRSLLNGPKTDVERRALAGGTGSSGGFTVPEPLAAEAIDRMRAQAVCMTAGASTVLMDSATLAMARLESDPTATWRTENSSITDADVTFGKVTFTARTLTAMVKASRELVQDSANMGPMLANAFGRALAIEVDRVALVGSGTPPEPRGLANTSGVLEVSMGENGAALPDFEQLMDLRLALHNANAPAPTAWILAPRTWKTIGSFVDLEGRWAGPPPYLENPTFLATTSVPVDQTQGTSDDCSSVYAGYFPNMMFGIRMALEIRALDQTFAGSGQIAFLAMMRADVQLAQPASFGRLVGIRP